MVPSLRRDVSAIRIGLALFNVHKDSHLPEVRQHDNSQSLLLPALLPIPELRSSFHYNSDPRLGRSHDAVSMYGTLVPLNVGL